jgi:endonuclease/exonuclease/phosphatase family metal-dependent hydrolase
VTLRLLSYNMRYGGAGRESALVDVINGASPDIVILQEATRPAVVEHVARHTGMIQWGSQRGRSLGYMSRRPIAHVEWHKPRLSRHAYLEIVPEGARWCAFGVHLSAVHAAWTERRRVYELRALLEAIGRRQPAPHVLIGDFNTVAPGEVFDPYKLPRRLRALVWLSGGRVRWRTIQTILDAGYIDAFRYLHPDVVGSTFQATNPHIRLDYLFVPRDSIPAVRSCTVVTTPPTRDASDHFPLLAELDV